MQDLEVVVSLLNLRVCMIFFNVRNAVNKFNCKCIISVWFYCHLHHLCTRALPPSGGHSQHCILTHIPQSLFFYLLVLLLYFKQKSTFNGTFICFWKMSEMDICSFQIQPIILALSLSLSHTHRQFLIHSLISTRSSGARKKKKKKKTTNHPLWLRINFTIILSVSHSLAKLKVQIGMLGGGAGVLRSHFFWKATSFMLTIFLVSTPLRDIVCYCLFFFSFFFLNGGGDNNRPVGWLTHEQQDHAWKTPPWFREITGSVHLAKTLPLNVLNNSR